MFFDEIQNVSEFEKVINSFRATLNVSIFITGSNSKILSSELSTHLLGRYISIKILSFNFSKYLELNDDKKSIDDKFLDYVDWGGMPQIYNTDSIQERKIYLRDLYNTVVLKDIIEKNNIKDINLLNRIIQFIMENIGGVISANSITNFLKSDKIKTSVDTFLNYIECINNSMIVSKVNRYNIRGKSVMSLYEKYYMADLGFLHLKSSPIEKKLEEELKI